MREVEIINRHNVSSALLDQLNSLPHARKYISGGVFAGEEDWSNEKISSCRHLFIKGKEPSLRQDNVYDFPYHSHAPIKILF